MFPSALTDICPRARQEWPILTLKIFTARIYVVTSGELVQAVFRNSKSFSFQPIANEGSERVFAVPKPIMKKFLQHDDESKDTLLVKTTKGMHTSLNHGLQILEMNSRALHTFAGILSKFGSEPKEIALHHWVRDSFTLASAAAVYGSDNPIAKDHSLIQSLEYVFLLCIHVNNN